MWGRCHFIKNLCKHLNPKDYKGHIPIIKPLPTLQLQKHLNLPFHVSMMEELVSMHLPTSASKLLLSYLLTMIRNCAWLARLWTLSEQWFGFVFFPFEMRTNRWKLIHFSVSHLLSLWPGNCRNSRLFVKRAQIKQIKIKLRAKMNSYVWFSGA